jgi:hypothetical protein
MPSIVSMLLDTISLEKCHTVMFSNKKINIDRGKRFHFGNVTISSRPSLTRKIRIIS